MSAAVDFDFLNSLFYRSLVCSLCCVGQVVQLSHLVWRRINSGSSRSSTARSVTVCCHSRIELLPHGRRRDDLVAAVPPAVSHSDHALELVEYAGTITAVYGGGLYGLDGRHDGRLYGHDTST